MGNNNSKKIIKEKMMEHQDNKQIKMNKTMMSFLDKKKERKICSKSNQNKEFNSKLNKQKDNFEKILI